LKLLRTFWLRVAIGSVTLASNMMFLAFVLVRSVTHTADAAVLVAAGLLPAGLSDQR
jgi:hypothetical protein